MPQAETNSARTQRAPRQRWRIRTYVFVLTVPILLLQVAIGLDERSRMIEDAEATAGHNASHLAGIAAALIGSGIESTRAEVAERATSAASPLDAGCAATVRDVGSALRGRVDVIDATGVTRCSSAPVAGATTASEPPPWLAQVLAGPALIAPVTDPNTGRLVAVIAAPLVDGSGAVVHTVDLITYGAAVAPLLGSGNEFVILVSDGAHVLVSSLEPQRWIGSPVADTGFASASGASKFRDLGATERLFGRSAIGSIGWTVYVGADRAHAVALAEQNANRNVALGTALLLLVLFAMVVVFRQIVNPISRLSGLVRDAIASGTSQPLIASGPREVEELAADFRELVTDRERELNDVRRLAATNSAILDSAIDSVVTIDSGGTIVEFNPAAEQTFGYSRAEAVGRQMAEIIVPQRLRDGHRAGLARYLATGEGPILGQRVEMMAMRKDGSELPVELTVTLVDIPGSPLFTGYLRDLTEQVRAREDLAASERRLQVILDNSPAFIHMKDLDGRYVFVNREGLRAIGRTRDEVIGRTDAELFPAAMARIYRGDDLETLRAAMPRQNERAVALPDGQERIVLSAKFPLIDADGIAYGTAGISTDITDAKRVEAERRFLQERLDQSQRLETLGQLAGGVAHDFNNLLAVILIHAKFVAGQTQGQVRDDVEQIRIAAERAAGLTRQLLVFGRRERVNLQPIDLAELIEGVPDVLARGIGLQIDLVVDASRDVPRVLADRGQMEQVLLNLAINARDAMPDGGTLTFRIDTDDAPELGPAPLSGQHVHLTVTDTGTGMPPEVVARAFEPFFTTKPPGEGTGLGLATVYGIITEAGGTVELTSTPGAGSTIHIVLPAAEPGSGGVVNDALEGLPIGHGETILVVDDEPALLAVTVRMLEDNGYDVISAGSPDEALTRAEGEDIHLLLTDFVMPKINGSQLADQMRGERPDLRVLVMSGYSHGLSNSVALGDETLRVLRKPFSERELLTWVHEVLSMP